MARDDRPQADRDPLRLDVGRLPRRRRVPRAADAGAAHHRQRGLPDARVVQRGAHDPRDDDDLPRPDAAAPRPRRLPRAAPARRAGARVPAAASALVLALSLRRDRPLPQLLRDGRPGRHRLERLRAALDAARAGQRPGLLDPRAAAAHGGRAVQRDQPRRDDPHPPGARDDVGARAAVLVVGARVVVGARRLPAGLRRGADDALRSTATARPTSSTRPAAAARCCSSTCSGSSRTRRSTR